MDNKALLRTSHKVRRPENANVGRQRMKRLMAISLMALGFVGTLAVADDADLNERRAKAARYERQADWRLHFEDWDKLAVFGAPSTNGAVVTTEMIKVKDIAEALAKAGEKKELAVIIVSHRFHSHYAKDTGEKQLDTLSERIRLAGFKRVVCLSETAVGNLPMKE